MTQAHNSNDPLDFLKGLWGNSGFSLPGMVAPTFDTDELEKRINDLKAVEGWLRMNLSMLQMTIQNLEMQRTTLTAVKAMSQMHGEANAADGETAPFAQAAMWPWQMMQQLQAQMAQASQQASDPQTATPPADQGNTAATSDAAGTAHRGSRKSPK